MKFPTSFLRTKAIVRMVLFAVMASAVIQVTAAPPQGQLLASMCYQCHGTNGQAVSGFESITGKSATEMYKSLLEMSQRRPENIMDLQARAYTPEQLRQVANYLATLSSSAPSEP